jgi:hypothetical protein
VRFGAWNLIFCQAPARGERAFKPLRGWLKAGFPEPGVFGERMVRMKKTLVISLLAMMILLGQVSCGRDKASLDRQYLALENVANEFSEKYRGLDKIQRELMPAVKHDRETQEKKYIDTSEVILSHTPLMTAWDKIDTLKMTIGHTQELVGTTKQVEKKHQLEFCRKRIKGLESLKTQSKTALDFLKPTDPQNLNPYVLQQLKKAKEIMSSLSALCDHAIEIYQEAIKILER